MIFLLIPVVGIFGYMGYLIYIMNFSLFKVGDLLVEKDQESWQNDYKIHVLKIGRSKYRFEWVGEGILNGHASDLSFGTVNLLYRKVK